MKWAASSYNEPDAAGVFSAWLLLSSICRRWQDAGAHPSLFLKRMIFLSTSRKTWREVQIAGQVPPQKQSIFFVLRVHCTVETKRSFFSSLLWGCLSFGSAQEKMHLKSGFWYEEIDTFVFWLKKENSIMLKLKWKCNYIIFIFSPSIHLFRVIGNNLAVFPIFQWRP